TAANKTKIAKPRKIRFPATRFFAAHATGRTATATKRIRRGRYKRPSPTITVAVNAKKVSPARKAQTANRSTRIKKNPLQIKRTYAGTKKVPVPNMFATLKEGFGPRGHSAQSVAALVGMLRKEKSRCCSINDGTQK